MDKEKFKNIIRKYRVCFYLDINDKFIKNLKLKGNVVDLGCGIAAHKEVILKTAQKYIGVDWESCKHDKSRIDVFANLNEDKLAFEDCSFDNALSLEVLEHLNNPPHILKEACRILKPGGNIIITTPFMWWIHEPPYDYFRYTKYGLEYLLKQNGFENIKIQPKTGFWFMWLLKLNYYLTQSAFKLPYLLLIISSIILLPLVYFNQLLGLFLDKIFGGYEKETAGYILMAQKKL